MSLKCHIFYCTITSKDVKFINETEDKITVTATVNEQDLRLWALQYALQVKVFFPKSLVDDIKCDIMKEVEQYK